MVGRRGDRPGSWALPRCAARQPPWRRDRSRPRLRQRGALDSAPRRALPRYGRRTILADGAAGPTQRPKRYVHLCRYGVGNVSSEQLRRGVCLLFAHPPTARGPTTLAAKGGELAEAWRVV